MDKISQDELLQYLYNEGSSEKKQYIQQLLQTDTELQEKFNDLKTAKNRLDKVKLISPDQRSVDNIFNYSKRGILEMDVCK
jgi:succinate dehydrogenase flavin-adding protein (antitoxin of CptAB toxin-antitoxin module)